MLNLFLLFISLFFISCSDISEKTLEPVPTIMLWEGGTRGLDLSKYKTDITASINVLDNRELDIRFVPEQDSIYLTPTDDTPPLTRVQILVNDVPHELLVHTRKMVKHTFIFKSDAPIANIVVMGGFNDWSRAKLPLLDKDNDGTFERTVFLKPERHEYKFVKDGKELIDPDNPVFISNNIGGWNSILDLSSHKIQPAGQWMKSSINGDRLYFDFIQPDDGALPVDVMVYFDNQRLHNDAFDPKPDGSLMVNCSSYKNGLLRITGVDSENRVIQENHTIIKNGSPINPKKDPDDWHFTILYNLMVDRFHDGDKTNNHPANDVDVHPLANFNGGDFAGIIQKLEEGYFTELGISSIWISPVQLQPESAYTEWIPPNRKFTGYHGYWPVAPRKTDPRYGSDQELKHLVDLAHQKGIKVILDFVSNHVHQEHPYFQEHRDWFGKVTTEDGTMNIRNWSEETRLTTWFDEFIPSFDYVSAPEAIAQVVEDACWWLETYDLDGFRQDAVKHVPHSFWKLLTSEMKKRFPEKKLYQIGESFGSDELILDYVNPGELDAQFNFSIYFNARGPFVSDEADFTFLSNLMMENFKTYQPINLMGNITSSHDQLRFIGLADGQVSFSDNGTDRTYFNPPNAVRSSTSYDKLAAFYAFNISIPGVPVLYYGEEIGLMGAGDPGNRRPMVFGQKLSISEKALKEQFGKINRLRRTYPSLAVGDFRLIKVDGPILIYEKRYFDEVVLVAFNHSSVVKTIEINDLNTWEIIYSNMEMDDAQTILTCPPYSYGFFKQK